MKNKNAEIVEWILNQGAEITREVLEKKLQEVYNLGRLDAYSEQVGKTLDDIRYNTLMLITSRKKKLYEENFYNKPSNEDVIQMKALEYLEEHISDIIIQYKEG